MVACLGWGSLIWRPDDLPVGDWRNDGPQAQVEFLRVSGDGRLTLVLDPAPDPTADPVATLWAPMTVCDWQTAVTELADRERTGTSSIDYWPKDGGEDPKELPGLGAWATHRDINHVIWTALTPRFEGTNGVRPTEDQAVGYLESLKGHARVRAEKYVRRAPTQIRTAYRRRFERCLGWTPDA